MRPEKPECVTHGAFAHRRRRGEITHTHLTAFEKRHQKAKPARIAEKREHVRQLEDMLRRAEVGETPANDGVVEPGMVVTVDFGGGDTEKFLLGARENLMEGDDLDVYSPQSAMGAAINGGSKGDKVSYTAPNGKELTVTIVDAVPYRV